MTLLEYFAGIQPELAALRHDFHAHPELGFEEHRTAGIVAAMLESLGCEVTTGVGGTGVVGTLRVGHGSGSIGLRADMDALPIEEASDLPYRSQSAGKMHACGHDGHMAMLLGTARYLAETKNFHGTVHMIFQPAEEGLGGAEAMIGDGLFQRFPCDYVYAIHNRTSLKLGTFAVRNGPMMAGAAVFDVTISGRGGHAARPEVQVDPILTASQLVVALQSIVSRNVAPNEPAVLTITDVSGGTGAYGVVPDKTVVRGTARSFGKETMASMEARIRQVAAGVCATYGATCEVDFRPTFSALVNNPDAARAIGDAAEELYGAANLDRDRPVLMGSDDFGSMLERVPGAYMDIGNGGGKAHTPDYNFSDAALPYGASVFARLIERELAADRPHATR